MTGAPARRSAHRRARPSLSGSGALRKRGDVLPPRARANALPDDPLPSLRQIAGGQIPPDMDTPSFRAEERRLSRSKFLVSPPSMTCLPKCRLGRQAPSLLSIGLVAQAPAAWGRPMSPLSLSQPRSRSGYPSRRRPRAGARAGAPRSRPRPDRPATPPARGPSGPAC